MTSSTRQSGTVAVIWQLSEEEMAQRSVTGRPRRIDTCRTRPVGR